jgi:glutathione S-transferase
MILYDLDAKNNIRLSPTAWRVKAALHHKGLAWEEIPVAFTDISKLNMHPTIPILVDGDKTLGESFDIIAYLDEKYPDKRVMTSISESKFFENWCNGTLHMPLAHLVLKDIYDVVLDKDRAYFKESREKRFNISLDTVQNGREERVIAFRALLNPVRASLKFKPYLGGDAPNFFDYCLWGTFKWGFAVATFDLLEKDDPILAWFNRVSL